MGAWAPTAHLQPLVGLNSLGWILHPSICAVLLLLSLWYSSCFSQQCRHSLSSQRQVSWFHQSYRKAVWLLGPAPTCPPVVPHCQECEIFLPGPEQLIWGWWDVWLWFWWFVLTRVGFISISDMAQKEVLCEIIVRFHTYQRVSSFPF